MSAPLIQLETDDFAQAARSLYSDVGDPLTTAVVRLIGRLQDCGGMAGSDPAGRDWAASYDRAAAATLGASQDAINACFKLSSMFAQTARNYEAADAASTAGVRHAIAAATATLADDCVIGLATEVPSASDASGGSGGAPTGWGVIADLVGYVWPNGHQDRLRAAAHAWRSCAESLWSLSEFVGVAAVPAMGHHLPEFDDMSTVCNGMYMHVREVAHAQFGLADACDELAHHLDVMHSEVESELISLVEWTVAIETTGAVVSVFTLGAAEGPTQAVETGRIAKTAARIGELIQKFMALARAAAQSIAAVVERAGAVAARMRAVLNVELSAATVTLASRVRVVRATRELGAVGRLSNDGEQIALRYIDNPKLFDPQVLRGMKMEDVSARIPSNWVREPSTRGGGTVYRDPGHRGRTIRLMPGYSHNTRPGAVNSGPYAVVAQAGVKIKIPLAGNPVL